ncbi:SDR family oxidoreductase [Amycolatopsis acidicola]|uniref:SDR family oxidoreductase n=1 Tax=Amycolatopsis acidicola TaxID=2596893 RepID=A0A5N0UM86_9PSEU|nr:SDR family oxidoreductase [Amycolatopsis acidicola]KAA9148954.1 SDR family oxidoreductase [Amycolatopsis acidicola]
MALVTGASRGLGAHIARALAADGWDVAVNYHSDDDGARRVVDEIHALGRKALAAKADVTDEDEVPGLVERAGRELGAIGALVVNATGPQPEIPLEALTWRDQLDQLEFFVKSPTLLAKAVLPGMKALGQGRIIQIGSDMAERALPEWSAYTAAKSAQHGLTRVWARELGPSGITVNLVAPGWIPVERHAGAPDGDRRSYVADVPLRRFGLPREVAAAVRFLASDAGSFVNGERITVNGGHTID